MYKCFRFKDGSAIPLEHQKDVNVELIKEENQLASVLTLNNLSSKW